MNLTALTRPAQPWLHLLVGTPSDATDALWNLERTASHPVAIRTIRGRKATTAHGFFDEAAAALQLPYYFGENWDAFNDCLTDLEWLRGDAFVIVFSDALKLLDAAPADAAKFVGVLQNAIKRWNHPSKKDKGKPFHVVFESAPADEAATTKRWHGLGLTLTKLS